MNNFYCFIVFFVAVIWISLVEGFSWLSCGNDSDPVKITSLKSFLDKNGILLLSGTGKVAFNLTSPIEAQLEVRKKFFWGWTIIPCIDDFGSCLYPDVCLLSPYLNSQCPTEFVENHIPCNCPVLQGQYSAKNVSIDLKFLPERIEKGIYRIKITLRKGKQRLICLIVTQTL